MAKVICDKHGVQFGMLVCEHVNGAIDNKVPLHYMSSLHSDFEGIWLCDKCTTDLDKILSDAARDAFLSRVKPPCVVCARAWSAFVKTR
jgi:hypothetical protein